MEGMMICWICKVRVSDDAVVAESEMWDVK